MPRKKRKHNYNNLKLLIAVLLTGTLVIVLLQRLNYRRVKFIHYDAFGIDMPITYSVHGIDVSKYQKQIEWADVESMNVEGTKISFVFIKATEGQKLTDKYFRYNWKSAHRHNIARGAYHFFIPTQDPVKQANYFISRVKLQPGDLPPVLDAEQASIFPVNVFRAKIRAWLNIIEAHYKVKPIIYTNAEFYRKYMGPEFNEYFLWVAHYYERKKPRIDRPWTFWQHNDRGNVSGIDAKVDFNVFNGDTAAFRQLLIQ